MWYSRESVIDAFKTGRIAACVSILIFSLNKRGEVNGWQKKSENSNVPCHSAPEKEEGLRAFEFFHNFFARLQKSLDSKNLVINARSVTITPSESIDAQRVQVVVNNT